MSETELKIELAKTHRFAERQVLLKRLWKLEREAGLKKSGRSGTMDRPAGERQPAGRAESVGD